MIGLFGVPDWPYDANIPVGSDAASRAESIARTAQQKYKALEAGLAKSLLLCETLWELLRDEHGWTDQDLYKKLQDVDLRDGVLDNKNQRQAVACPDCRRTVSPRHPACLYCGRVIDTSPFTIG